MQSIPTRIHGVSIDKLDDIARPRRQPQGSGKSARKVNRRSSWKSSEVIVDGGFLNEPSFLAHEQVQRRYRCLLGEVFVAVVDLRRGSPTYRRWLGVTLSSNDRRRLSVPSGVACGWIALSPHAQLRLQSDQAVPRDQWNRLQWNDPKIGIEWPIAPTVIGSTARRGRKFQSFVKSELPVFFPEPNDVGEFPNLLHNRVSNNRLSNNKLQKHRRGGQVHAIRMAVPEGLGDTSIATRNCQATNCVTMSSVTAKTNSVTGVAAASPQANCLPKTSDLSEVDPTMRKRPLILVIGSSGQLGQDLCRHLRSFGTVIGACRAPDRNQLVPVPIKVDIGRPASLRQVIRQVRPQIIVNASGMTDVNRAEAEPRLAQMVNATAPSIMAEEAQRCGSAVVHFCTDMVFAGDGERPYSEQDHAAPTCHYGRTKLLGTEAILASGVPHLVLRSGWLYSTHGENFVRGIMDMSLYRNSLTLSCDHFGSPTSTDWLAQVTNALLSRTCESPVKWMEEHGGLYHCATLGYASRAEAGEQILADIRQQGMPVVLKKIVPVLLSDQPSLARRPTNCRLNCTRIATQFGLVLPRWQDQLTQQIELMVGDISAIRSRVA